MLKRIYITTYKRATDQRTWHRLSPKLQKETVLSVDWEERDLYPGYPIEVLPEGLHRLNAKRQYILQTAPATEIVLLDDDLQFYTRKQPGDWHLRDSTLEDTDQMFATVFKELAGDFAHVGISAREGNNTVETDEAYNGRMMRLLGYHLPTLRAVCTFPLVDCMEDFHLTLQLLTHGISNCVHYGWAQGQKNSNAPGGCSTYRTLEYQEERAKELATLFPDYVKLVRKTTKTAWGGGERTDVRVSWKKAYEAGKRERDKC
jgi:hypothetical protein